MFRTLCITQLATPRANANYRSVDYPSASFLRFTQDKQGLLTHFTYLEIPQYKLYLLIMLTKTDFDQIGKVVRKVVREEVEAEVSDAKNTLGAQIRMTKLELKHEILELDDRLKTTEIRLSDLDEKLSGVEKDVKDIKKRVRKTEKTVDKAIGMLDTDIVAVRKRVVKIEEHLNL